MKKLCPMLILLFSACGYTMAQTSTLDKQYIFPGKKEVIEMACKKNAAGYDFTIFLIGSSGSKADSLTRRLTAINPPVLSLVLGTMLDSLYGKQTPKDTLSTRPYYPFFAIQILADVSSAFTDNTSEIIPRSGLLEVYQAFYTVNSEDITKFKIDSTLKDYKPQQNVSASKRQFFGSDSLSEYALKLIAQEQTCLDCNSELTGYKTHKKINACKLSQMNSILTDSINSMIADITAIEKKINTDNSSAIIDNMAILKSNGYLNTLNNLYVEYLQKRKFYIGLIRYKGTVSKIVESLDSIHYSSTLLIHSKDSLYNEMMKDTFKLISASNELDKLISEKRKCSENKSTELDLKAIIAHIQSDIRTGNPSSDISFRNDSIELVKLQSQDNCHIFTNQINSILSFLSTHSQKNAKRMTLIKNDQSMIAKYDSITKSKVLGDFADKCTIKSVDIEFTGGTISNIWIKADKNGKVIRFTNSYPIPFSTKMDYEQMAKAQLYNIENPGEFTTLASILVYDPQFYNLSQDYSPGDTVVQITPENRIRIMYKKEINLVVQGKIYTDFNGVAANSPNGLVQTEVGMKANLWSVYRKYIVPQPKFKLSNTKQRSSYTGWFNYYYPTFAITKIEDKDRYLDVLHTDSIVFYTVKGANGKDSTVSGKDPTLPKGKNNFSYASTINLLRYSFLNIRPLYFNILSLNTPAIKSSFHFDVGFSWFITAMRDSVATQKDSTTTLSLNTYNVNSTATNLSILWEYSFDPRIHITASATLMWFKLWDKVLNQAGDPDLYKNQLQYRKTEEWIFNPTFTASYTPIKSTEIYLRLCYYGVLEDMRQNFIQTQLGVAFKFIK